MQTRSRGYLLCASGMVVLGASMAASATLVDLPVLGGQSVRYAVAGAVLLAVMAWRRVSFTVPRPRESGRLVLLAAVGLVGFSVLVIEGTRRTDPSVVGAVVGASPVVLSLTAVLRGDRRASGRTVAAALVVTTGVLVVEGVITGSSGAALPDGAGTAGAAGVSGLLWAVGALGCEVGFSLLALPLLRTLGPLRVSAYACVAAAVLLAVAGVLAPGPFLRVPDLRELVALAYLAIVVTALAFLLWYSGLAALGPARAGLFAGLVPVAALGASVALGLEPFTAHAGLGALVVASGLLLGLAPRRTATHREAPGAGRARAVGQERSTPTN